MRGGLASSADGRHVAWCTAGRIVLFDVAGRARLAEAELDFDGATDLALAPTAPDRLLVLRARDGVTLVRVLALPDLRVVLDAQLRGEARLAATSGTVALLQTGREALTALDLADLRTAALAVRGPIQLVTDLSDGRILVCSHGRLEAWSVAERRPTHRMSLPVPSDAAFGGTADRGRIQWFAAAAPPGTISLLRVSDRMQQTRLDAGGQLEAIAVDPASAIAVAAIRPAADAAVELAVLSFATQARHTLAFDGCVTSFCLVGAPADAVVIAREDGAPLLVPLAPATARAEPLEAADGGRPGEAGEPTGTEPVPANDLGERLEQWRGQVRAAVAGAPQRLRAPGGLGLFSGEPQSRSRAELYAWGLSARARTTTSPPPPPQGGRLNELVARFALDTRSRALLALLYASWLDGDGRTGLPVGVIARVLGNDEDAWIDALAHGRLGRMGWLRSRYGRTRLRPTLGAFLDETPPRIALVEPAGEIDLVAEPPAGAARLQLADGVPPDEPLRAPATGLNRPVAAIDAGAMPARRPARAFADHVLEARLHGALPIVLPATAPLAPELLDGPALVAVRGPAPPPWDELAEWRLPPRPPSEPTEPAAPGDGERLS